MALREIRLEGDPILRKKSKKIDVIDERIISLAEDMVETMVAEYGLGLAAPQVGVLRRIVVVLIDEQPVVMINPEIVNSDGEVLDIEGCLSVPEMAGNVKRPQNVTVKFLNLKNAEIEYEAEGYIARAICHEIDHLNGILYVDKIEGDLFKSASGGEEAI